MHPRLAYLASNEGECMEEAFSVFSVSCLQIWFIKIIKIKTSKEGVRSPRYRLPMRGPGIEESMESNLDGVI